MSTEPQLESRSRRWYGYSTAFTIGLAIVVCVTGLMLFFKISPQTVKEAHEWISIAFVIAATAHTIRHRRVMLRYMKVWPFWAATVCVLALTGMFVVGEGGEGPRGNPMHRAMALLEGARVGQIAEMANIPEDVALQKLRAEGVLVNNGQDKLETLAQSTRRPVPELLRIILPE